ncbi:hypothetical protein COOONC_04907 [Cooperia oncophora]
MRAGASSPNICKSATKVAASSGCTMISPYGFEKTDTLNNRFRDWNYRTSTGEPVTFKVDGERFEGGSKTLKFATNTKYKIALSSKPPAEFQGAAFHIVADTMERSRPFRGHTLPVVTGTDCTNGTPSKGMGVLRTSVHVVHRRRRGYTIVPSLRKHVIKFWMPVRLFLLCWISMKGPDGILKRQLQSKFYEKDDSHADWGHKLECIQWICSVDGTGNISVVEELIK